MQSIKDALDSVGGDTIQHLYDYVEMQKEIADESGNFYQIVEATRLGLDVGLAIYAYADSKERICRE